MTFASNLPPVPGGPFSPDALVVRCSSCGTITAAADALNTCASCFNDLSNTEPVLYQSLGDTGVKPPPAAAPPERTDEAGARTEAPEDGAVCPACQLAVDDQVDSLCPHCLTMLPPVLMLIVGERQERLRSGDVLGRAGTVATDLFSSILEVSRQHARLLARDGRWMVEAMSASNITRLDGHVIARSAVAPLTGRHTLSMSSRCDVVLELVCKGEPGSGDSGT